MNKPYETPELIVHGDIEIITQEVARDFNPGASDLN